MNQQNTGVSCIQAASVFAVNPSIRPAIVFYGVVLPHSLIIYSKRYRSPAERSAAVFVVHH